MKKSAILLLLFCLGMVFRAAAQERNVVQGVCKDEDGRVIENVSVYAHDSVLVAITDPKGRFTYAHAHAGEILRFAHLVFEPTYYTIKKKDINGKSLNIKMDIRSHTLLEVEVTATDSVYITGWRHFFGTGISYYRNILGHDNEPILLHYIEDEESASSVRKIRGGWEADFIEPIYAPIYAIDNRFYLFAFVDHETLVFDTEGKVLERYPLTFHEYRKWNGKMEPDRRWKQNILVDAARKEFYTIFVNDGLGTLNRIDLKTGTVKPVMDLSGYPFAEMVRVYNGVLYFLYPRGQNHRKALYQVRIE